MASGWTAFILSCGIRYRRPSERERVRAPAPNLIAASTALLSPHRLVLVICYDVLKHLLAPIKDHRVDGSPVCSRSCVIASPDVSVGS